MAQKAAALLHAKMMSGGVMMRLSDADMPQDRAQAYAIQDEIEKAKGGQRCGWKIAATSKAGQAHIGVDGPIAGRFVRSMVFEEGEIVPFGHNKMAVAEAEFVFEFEKDIAPHNTPYEIEDVLAHVGSAYLGLELPDSRFADFAAVGALQLIADNACAYQFVKGPKMPDIWREMDLSAHPVTATLKGGAHYEGKGANVLGHPLIALTWLVNELATYNIYPRAGEFVTTGTCVTPVPIRPDDMIELDFGILGRMSCRMGSA